MTARRTEFAACAGPECSRFTFTSLGLYCHAHEEQLRRRADASALTPLRVFDTPQERFASFVIEQEDGCRIWRGATDGGRRYGSFALGGKLLRAHRVAYEWARGPVPAGLVIDHLCRVTLCVNPDHLEPVTQRENVLRGEALQAKNAAKTHCIRGHEFTPENTRIPKRGGRVCRACQRRPERAEQRRRWQEKRRAESQVAA